MKLNRLVWMGCVLFSAAAWTVIIATIVHLLK